MLPRKDINFNSDEKYLTIDRKEIFLYSAKLDSEFFEDLYLMDYSLLVFKMSFDDEESVNQFEEFKQTRDYVYYDKHIFVSKTERNTAYIIVIIDYLQTYNLKKKMENNIKNYLTERPENYDDISCVPPDVYAQRFYKYMLQITNF
jgi:hypothetical protein